MGKHQGEAMEWVKAALFMSNLIDIVNATEKMSILDKRSGV
jgi:hypothetical protein